MTTRFPQLPVLGRVPKKRKVDLTKTITLAQLHEILDSEDVNYYLSDAEDRDYAMQLIRDAAKKLAAPRG